MLKRDEVANPRSCLNKAGDDEPIFVIRAKDILAVETVLAWAQLAEYQKLHEPEKVAEARELVAKIKAWRQERGLSFDPTI